MGGRRCQFLLMGSDSGRISARAAGAERCQRGLMGNLLSGTSAAAAMPTTHIDPNSAATCTRDFMAHTSSPANPDFRRLLPQAANSSAQLYYMPGQVIGSYLRADTGKNFDIIGLPLCGPKLLANTLRATPWNDANSLA